MEVDGWHPDPFGIHEERLFAHGKPTSLVRDDGIGSFATPPGVADPVEAGSAEPGGEAIGPGLEAGAPAASASQRAGSTPRVRPVSNGEGPRRPTKPMVALAALLIAAGVVVGIIGINGVGGSGGAATTTTTTENPFLKALPDLPRITAETAPTPTLGAVPTTIDLAPIEQEILALPRTTTAAAAPSTKARSSAPTAAHSAPPTTRPPKRVTATPAVVPGTTLPLTTMTTTVGQADAAWYASYGSVFNTLQSDVEKLDRSLASTDETYYPNVHPYWQDLLIDANYAASLPGIPDASAQSVWSTALSDLSEGSTACILGTAGVPGAVSFVPATFDKGSALVTTGTTGLAQALSSVEATAAATSVASRSAVSGWDQAHKAALTTLQADITTLNAAFPSAGPTDFSAIDPDWQKLMTDAQSAVTLPPIPDALIQSYWSTALNDLIGGSSDCIGSSEALPPNLFDQGVATIETGADFLTTAAQAIQTLLG